MNNKPDASTFRNPLTGPHYNLPEDDTTNSVLRRKPQKLPTIKSRIDVKTCQNWWRTYYFQTHICIQDTGHLLACKQITFSCITNLNKEIFYSQVFMRVLLWKMCLKQAQAYKGGNGSCNFGFRRMKSATKHTFTSIQTMTNQSTEPYAMSKMQSSRNFDCKIAIYVKWQK